MAATKSGSAIIALGTANAAFTQLATTAVTTRSGTTATATVTNTTLAVNDYILVQGHDLAEYNGVFQVASLISTTGITYVIKADPGASSGTTVMTIDKVTMGTALNMTTDYGAIVEGAIQNYNTGPTIAPQVWKGVAITGSALVDYRWSLYVTGDSVAKSMTPIRDILDVGYMYVNYCVCRNTGQPVDVVIQASEVTAI